MDPMIIHYRVKEQLMSLQILQQESYFVELRNQD